MLGVVALAVAGYFLWPDSKLPDPPLFTLTTTPAQAVVFLNGDSVGATPLNNYPLDVGTGSLALRILKTDYVPVETTLVAVAGVPLVVNFDLERTTTAASVDSIRRATLRITSSPGNARVQINGEDRGTTDDSGVLEVADVEPGVVTVHIVKNGYNDWRSTVQAVAGETLRVSAPLSEIGSDGTREEATGTLVVRVEPRGTVRVQGANCRVGAACRVPIGAQRVTCSRNGSQATTTVQIRANRQTSLTCYTEREVALQVRREGGSLFWATVLIDNVVYDRVQDKIVSLGAGRHRIEARREGFDVIDPVRTIDIKPLFAQQQREIVMFQIRGE